LIAAVALAWRPEAMSESVAKGIKNAMLIMLFVRFSIPLAAIGSEVLYEGFLAEQYNESTQKLEQTKDTIHELNKQQEQQIPDEESMMDKAKRWFDSAAQSIDIENRYEEYKNVAADASKHAINLIVVFVIQTVLFPLLFLWIIYRFLRDVGRKLV
jgi:hypothetical protein